MDSKVELNDSKAKAVTIEELEKVLERFESEAELHKFRNTAIYHCFRHCLYMNVREVSRRSPSKVPSKVSGTGIREKH